MARPDGEQDHKCCGVVEEAAAKSKRRRDKRRSKPQPWLMLKFTVAFTLGIIGYASYVYIGRFCVPMIRKNHGALGGRRIGIPFLVIFCILLVMMLWAYVMVVFTGPGKAKDFVQKSEQPKWDNPVPRWWDPENDIGGGPYQYTPENTNGSAASSGQPSKPPPAHVAEKPAHVRDGNVGEMDAVLPLAAARTRPDAVESTMDDSATQQQEPGNTPPRLPMMYTRAPPTNPVLLPEYRYCQRDGFVKPLRAHHCRACGTCVLKYDHHCPWIGQCVGALNHKFFVHFLQWAAVFCMWSFATLVAGTVNMSRTSSVDPEFIVAIALSGLFIFFTVALLITHIRLIILNQSTVDSLKAQHMKEREKAVLARMFSWYQFGEKRKAKKEWDREWGDIDTEGNIWWLGSARKNWEAVMGHSVWEWFLPIGRSSTDGVNWPINPRFDSEGRWRPRREWPPELR